MGCKEPFDVVIIGAGTAGSAMVHALATIPRPKPWTIALIERSFSEPDRIVGELLQPGGVQALRELGMLSSLNGIGAMPVEGYNLIKGTQSVQVSFPEGEAGRCFHHGRFVMGLRRIALQNENVTAIQGNATRLIECPITQRVLGVDVVLKVSADASGTRQGKLAVYGGLVIVADGCFSNFRNTVLAKSACKPKTYSHTIASVLKDAVLPVPKYGTIVLPPGLGPVALYPLTERETRIWVDVQGTLPSDVRVS
jgi:squalene monooxygenase